MSDMEITLIAIVVIAIVGWAFFFPTILAFKRGNLNRWTVLLGNIFFGWTLFGWIVCLLMAAWGQTEAGARWEAARERLSIDADYALVKMGRRLDEVVERREPTFRSRLHS